MKRTLAFFIAIIMLFAFSSCEREFENRDLYQYDTFLNSKWGSDPEEVFSDLGLMKNQVARQPDSVNKENGYPEGTFSYKIIKKSSMYGTPVSVELLFADSLFEIPCHIGLYAVKVNFIESYPDNFAANSVQWEPSDYKLDIDIATEEINKRILYNTNSEEYKDGNWSVRKWSCKATPGSIGDELKGALESVPSEGGVSINDKPLSSMEVYYGNKEEYSYMIYEGLSAAVLKNM